MNMEVSFRCQHLSLCLLQLLYHTLLPSQRATPGQSVPQPLGLWQTRPPERHLVPVLFKSHIQPLGEASRNSGLTAAIMTTSPLPLPFPAAELWTSGTASGGSGGWMRAGKMKLHPDKMEALLVGGRCGPEAGMPSVLDGAAPSLLTGAESATGMLLERGFYWTQKGQQWPWATCTSFGSF